MASTYLRLGDGLIVRFSMSSILIIGGHAAAGSPEIPETAETRDAADLSIGTNNGRCNLMSPANRHVTRAYYALVQGRGPRFRTTPCCR